MFFYNLQQHLFVKQEITLYLWLLDLLDQPPCYSLDFQDSLKSFQEQFLEVEVSWDFSGFLVYGID